jgi:DinB superfamily
MEPWLRGTIEGLHPAAAHLLYTFEQAREELVLFCGDFSVEDLWRRPHASVAPVGFQLRHIAGSVDRLTTYLRGEQLDAGQLAVMRQELVAGPGFAELMPALDHEFVRTEAVVRSIAPESYFERRVVGRKQLPTSVGGLIVHISEHTQRHLGQAVLTAKLVRG